MGNCANSKAKRNSQIIIQKSKNKEQGIIEQSNSVSIPINIQLPSNVSQLQSPTMDSLQDVEFQISQSYIQRQSSSEQQQYLQLNMKSFDTIGIMKFQIYQKTKILPKNQLIYLKVDGQKIIFNDQFLSIKSFQEELSEHIQKCQNISKRPVLKLAVYRQKSSLDSIIKEQKK